MGVYARKHAHTRGRERFVPAVSGTGPALPGTAGACHRGSVTARPRGIRPDGPARRHRPRSPQPGGRIRLPGTGSGHLGKNFSAIPTASAPPVSGRRSRNCWSAARGRSWPARHGARPCQGPNSVLSGSPRKLGDVHIDSIFRTMGSAVIRFRWLVLLIWVFGAIAAVSLLPSLNSVTQNNNTKFLPASAPSEHAAQLAAPFGTAALIPIPLVAARSSGPLTHADISAVTALPARLKTVSGVAKVQDAGVSSDGHAIHLVVLAQQGGGNQNYATDLINGLRAKIAQAGLPPGLQAHLAGDIAAQVDQQKTSGKTGNKIELLSLLFIIALLVLIFRSFTLALVTVIPPLLSFAIAGPL